MSRIMTPQDDRPDVRVLDEEVWDNPARLSAAELYNHAGSGARPRPAALDDLEDDR